MGGGNEGGNSNTCPEDFANAGKNGMLDDPSRLHSGARALSFHTDEAAVVKFSGLLVRVAVCLGLCLNWGLSSAWAQRELKDIPNPDPELERKSFIVADGFEVNLYAADPLLAKPIQMNFDAQGRLWIASSSVYPQIEPGKKADDKVLVLEDSNQDGKADKTTVFADGLLIPTGVVPGDGGVYVANSTELVHFSDTDGDGKADDRRVVLSGFGTEDTHHIIHTFRFGPDGQFYFNQSIYIHSHVETPHGVRRLNGGGIWQFRPETLEMAVFARGFVNTWGHHFDRWGQSFATDGAFGEGINYVFPGAAYFTAVGMPRIMKGLNPGSPKHCGLEVVSGRHLPESWQGNMLTNDFRGHRVCRFVVTPDGSGYASKEETELIKTTHVAFRPIDIKMGPEGAIYIADWYNPIIQHGEVDFRDERRDHTHGRIWRVTAKGRPALPYPKIVGASVAELLEALKAPEDFTRHHAKLELKARGAAVVPDVLAWFNKLDPQDPQFHHLQVEALWALQSLDVPNPEILGKVLNSPDPRARAAAVRVVPFWANRLPDFHSQEMLARLVLDEHPQVRLEAVRALANFPNSHSVEVAMRALDRPVDKNIDYALWLTARDLQPVWMEALHQNKLSFDGNLRHMTFVLQASGAADALKPLVQALKDGRIDADRIDGVVQLIAAMGQPDDLRALLDLAQTAGKTGQGLVYLTQLENAARFRNIRPVGDVQPTVLELLKSTSDEASLAVLLRLSGFWKVSSTYAHVVEVASGESSASMNLVRAALAGLVAYGGEQGKAPLLKRAQDKSTIPAVRVETLAALAAMDPGASANLSVALLRELPENLDPTAAIQALMNVKGGAEALTAALKNQTLPEPAARLAVRAIRRTIKADPAVLEALSQAGKIQNRALTLTPEEKQQLVTAVKETGNPVHGEAIFRRRDLSCLKCHAIGGAGGLVGPDLVSLGASAQIDYIIDSLLEPNKQVKEGYHSIVAVNDQGQVFTGVKVRQTDNDLILRDANDQEIAIPLKTIEEQSNSGSLMPAGQIDDLTRPELIDLVRFLSELGKVGDFAVGKARVVRRWKTLPNTPAVAQRLQNANLADIALSNSELGWESAYSQVSGNLPVADLPVLAIPGHPQVSLLRAELDVTTGGEVQLQLAPQAGIRVWHEGHELPAASLLKLQLKPGLSRLLIAIDRTQPATSVRLEWPDHPSSAQFQFVNGK